MIRDLLNKHLFPTFQENNLELNKKPKNLSVILVIGYPRRRVESLGGEREWWQQWGCEG